MAGAAVSVAGFARADERARQGAVRPALGATGSFAATARKGSRRGRSGFLRFGPTTATTAAAALDHAAR